jgi:hypothetical protein
MSTAVHVCLGGAPLESRNAQVRMQFGEGPRREVVGVIGEEANRVDIPIDRNHPGG